MYKSLCCLVVAAFLASSQVPSFQSVELLEANGSPIQATTGNGSPCVTDWNGDGKKDLLLGQFSGGKIRLFLNSGTNSAPVLTTSTFLQADGRDISVYAS
jgi:hypothetical protein